MKKLNKGLVIKSIIVLIVVGFNIYAINRRIDLVSWEWAENVIDYGYDSTNYNEWKYKQNFLDKGIINYRERQVKKIFYTNPNDKNAQEEYEKLMLKIAWNAGKDIK